jgi:hypothetical protein
MPVSYQIIPEHKYPHQMTQINDNTEVSRTYSTNADVNAVLCVFMSPKGRDNVVQTIDTGAAGFVKEYGLGSYANYGQPLLNAYAAAANGSSTVHCLRVTADDASYANSTLVAKYKVTDGTLQVKFVNRASDEELTDLTNLEDCCSVDKAEDDEGFKSVKLFSVAYVGKGTYGKNVRWRIRSDVGSDKQNDFKNYLFDVYQYEDILELSESFSVVFVDDAVYSGTTLSAYDVLNDVDDGSNLLQVEVNYAGFQAIYDTYVENNPDTEYTIENFDVLLGLDKTTKEAIENYEIIPEDLEVEEGKEAAIAITSTGGVALIGGTDGALALDADPNIVSKNRFPTTLILDANYPISVKLALASLATRRTDCMAMIDCGLNIATKASLLSYVESNLSDFINSRIHTIEGYAMKVRDPYTQKTITVTSTYWIARNYPVHFSNWGGKHKPMAGNTYGIIGGYIKNSVYPVYDEDLDSEIMDKLADKHINFAKYNPNQVIVRATQDTRQSKLTNLSEQNNMLVVLDIKRDAELLASQIEYEFSEASDIARFNAALANITDKYAAAQVRSITASFSKNSWEAEHQTIHLNIAVVHKDLVRNTIIEIDVNRE